ncbi:MULTISPECIES: hypothetical protein [Bacillus]|uniref:hypothetical protein n=1 Tax=Bacillus TaxID=1386 RepID=UPI0002E041D1|nr:MULTISPECIES: hypothetical protein [Bacillus]
MRKLLFYLPALLTLFVIFILDQSWLKIVLLIILAMSVVIAKYKRRQLDLEDIEYDERVNINIRYWSFGFLVIMNSLLICYLILVSQFDMTAWFTLDYMMLYLILSLLIAFYIIPSIAKKF